ncbi:MULTISPECIES: hypothetical protein [Xanthomonas]|uniref:hypothetical protein n=1 Tax=Xanthomonas TaxID=338 RepID=UPI001ADC8FFC|nr:MULTISPECIES: hypothetical protein [unclassified Xanthomonas]MBO9872937.1 hypothetical protein [Xanthomonas sp. D-93]WNH44844.1 hypothetical protein PG878_20465 [Xanthomonas sp. A6251]
MAGLQGDVAAGGELGALDGLIAGAGGLLEALARFYGGTCIDRGQAGAVEVVAGDHGQAIAGVELGDQPLDFLRPGQLFFQITSGELNLCISLNYRPRPQLRHFLRETLLTGMDFPVPS